ncbi:MAG: hypothetical protein JNK48_03080 [Bryobacterales bacterium]|nr:hypothetical protein [Bryobacterales bacterium]
MRKYLIACLLPVMAVAIFSSGDRSKSAAGERISPVQKSMKLYDVERRQEEMNRTMDRFRPAEPE